jgi:hypothetical protein
MVGNYHLTIDQLHCCLLNGSWLKNPIDYDGGIFKRATDLLYERKEVSSTRVDCIKIKEFVGSYLVEISPNTHISIYDFITFK